MILLISEISIRLALATAWIIMELYAEPFHRVAAPGGWGDYGFPHGDSTVSTVELGIICVVAPFFVFPVNSIIQKLWGPWTRQKALEDLKKAFLGFTLAALLDGVITEVIKDLYGGLRPDFLSRCFGNNYVIKDSSFSNNIPNCISTSLEMETVVRDGRKSFPSGHSSVGFACFGYIALYLWNQLSKHKDSLGGNIIAIPSLVMLVPLWIAISRTSDYRHHLRDIIAGAILGSSIAILCFFYYYPLNKKSRENSTKHERRAHSELSEMV